MTDAGSNTRLTEEMALSWVQQRIFSSEYSLGCGDAGATGPGCIGLEPEYFVLTREGQRRVPLFDGPAGPGVVEALRNASDRDEWIQEELGGPGVAPGFLMKNGGRLTFEPGAQVEHSTATHPTALSALRDIDDTARRLQAAFDPLGADLVAVSVDRWNLPDDVPQQLDAPRYHAMAAFLDKHGVHGRTMMRNTTSLQINLDLGPPEVAQERWELSYLLSPFTTAVFSSSAKDGFANARSHAWQNLDSSRTGFPRGLVAGDGREPAQQWLEFALGADVLLFRGEGDTALAGEPGYSFGTWLREGHPKHGTPTLDDFAYHLTTLFPEVRPRGFLEVRTLDSLPARWRAAPVVFYTALLYCPDARHKALEYLSAWRTRLPELWHEAAQHGMQLAEVRAAAQPIFELALAGAERLPDGYIGPEHLEKLREFFETYTAQGLSPSNDFDGTLADFAWGRVVSAN